MSGSGSGRRPDGDDAVRVVLLRGAGYHIAAGTDDIAERPNESGTAAPKL